MAVEYAKLRQDVRDYLNALRQTHELLYRLDASFLTVTYTDICERPRAVLARALSFMGVRAPPAAHVAVASRFQQSAPPSLRAKVSNLDGVCAAARADAASGVYRWLESE